MMHGTLLFKNGEKMAVRLSTNFGEPPPIYYFRKAVLDEGFTSIRKKIQELPLEEIKIQHVTIPFRLIQISRSKEVAVYEEV